MPFTTSFSKKALQLNRIMKNIFILSILAVNYLNSMHAPIKPTTQIIELPTPTITILSLEAGQPIMKVLKQSRFNSSAIDAYISKPQIICPVIKNGLNWSAVYALAGTKKVESANPDRIKLVKEIIALRPKKTIQKECSNKNITKDYNLRIHIKCLYCHSIISAKELESHRISCPANPQ